MRLWPLLLLACGGGGPTFDGTWRGPVSSVDMCSGGSSTVEGAVEWAVAQAGAQLSITPDGGSCGTFLADVTGSSADIKGKACGAGTTIDSGKLTLESTALRISIAFTYPVAMGSCSRVTTGTLSR